MYVWLDALTNYITAVGHPNDGDALWEYWPADLHMVGKDILRFHTVYWPAFLMAAGIEPPKRVFAHGWWTNEGQKISKSLGNVIDPFELVDRYGLDPIRYFLLRQVPFGNDGDFSHQAMVHRLNGDLANDLGNLCQRVLSMIFRNCDGNIPPSHELTEGDIAFVDGIAASIEELRKLMEAQSFHQALELIWRHVGNANRYVDEQAPWELRKSDPVRMETVLYTLSEAIRNLALLTSPFMPDAMTRIFDQMGVAATERTFTHLGRAHGLAEGTRLAGKPQPIFPRFVEEEGPDVLVDSHCHLDYLERDGDLDEAVERARQAGVGTIVTICTKVSEFETIKRIAERYDDIWCTVGIHPHEAATEPQVTTAQLLEMAQHPKVVGIGETGLDYYYEHSPREAQKNSFRTHIAAARESGLPLIVHTRDADDDTMEILAEAYADGAFPGLIHCYQHRSRSFGKSIKNWILYFDSRYRNL